MTTLCRAMFAASLMITLGCQPSTVAPAAPVGLTASAALGQVTLRWPTVAGATGYRVSRGTASGVFSWHIEVGAKTTYVDTAVSTVPTQYFYAVAAINAHGSSASSTQTSATPGSYTGAPFLIAPAHESKPVLGMDFEWSDPASFTSYSFVLIDRATDLVVYSTALSASAGPCAGGTTCVLSPGMPGYPPPTALDTRALKWTVLGNGSWATGGSGNYNHIYPLPPEATDLVVNWNGDTVSLNWPAASGAASYHASFMNWAYVTSSEMHATASVCFGLACAATADVSQIPFGTVHVRLRACGTSGACSTGITADAHKACPAAMRAPALITPLEASVVNGLTTLRWAEPTAAERYAIQFQKDEGGDLLSVVKDEVLWRSQIACNGRGNETVCTRNYGLGDGHYLALISASCGDAWGPQKIISFRVNVTGAAQTQVSPRVLSPRTGATTSIQPIVLWSQLRDVENYEIVVASAAGLSSAFGVRCRSAICAFDYAQEGLKISGAHTVAVRVKDPGMPLSQAVPFTATTTYLPPPATQTAPYAHQHLGAANVVTIEYETDVQAPLSMVTINGPAGLHFTGPVAPRSACAYVPAGSGVVQRCSLLSAALGSAGNYTATVSTGTPNTMSGSGRYWGAMPPSLAFTRDPPPVGARDIYSVFAQNSQFLPESGLFGHVGGASSAWGLSDRQRAGRLRDYICAKNFDVVVLSEVFVAEAQDELSKVLKGAYPYFLAHIDTAGIASVDEAFAEQDSGLAIFSKFAPEAINPGATSNYQGTSDTLNELDDVSPLVPPQFGWPQLASFKANDFVWWKQYGECEGLDCMAAKGFAGIRLKNPKTGAPLLIGWTHTQSATNNITDAYQALTHQVLDDAAPVVALMRKSAPPAYDALLFGDWNLNMPPSVGRHPKFDGAGSNHQSDGGGDLSLMYGLNTVDDPGNAVDQRANPHFDALLPDPPAAIGEPASGSPKTVFQQYRLAFDPRHANPPFPDFYDLWLENPAGDPGLTFDVTNRRSHISCNEHERETCGGRHYDNADLDKFDRGSRYDSVLARFSKSNIPNAPGTGDYPNAPSGPLFNWERGSCVQHVSLARDFLYSDHFGTVVEVGPAAPQCNAATAKADPHLWRVPNSIPLPDANKHGYDKEAGVHDGLFRHGGANEWFYIKDPGAFDIIIEGSDATMNGVIVEAFLANDLSDPIAIADATQHVDGYLPGKPGCNKEVNEQSIDNPDAQTGGVIADECAGADTRVTYRVPQGGLYVRIVPADPLRRGKRCETCTGSYHMRFRERTCRVPKEAIVVSSGILNDGLSTAEKGWFGRDQKQCWFQIELQAPTSSSDPQTLRVANIGSMSNQGCLAKVSLGGDCSTGYDVDVYKSKADAQANVALPNSHFRQAAAVPANGTENILLVDNAWDLMVERDTGRKAYYFKVTRDNPTRPHDAALNYDTNLKSVVFQVVASTDIEDDYITTGWLPFVGTFIINNPFDKTDEDRVRQFANDGQIRFDDVELNIDNQGGDYFKFADRGPDGREIVAGAKRGYGGTWKTDDKIGTWVNYTRFARVEVIELDDLSAWDWTIADHLLCGKTGTTPPPGGWQAARFQALWDTLPASASTNGNRSGGDSFDYNDICGGADGLVTWAYKFRAGVYRPQ